MFSEDRETKIQERSKLKALKLSKFLSLVAALFFLLAGLINIKTFMGNADFINLVIAIVNFMAAICFFIGALLRNKELNKKK